MSEWIYCQSCGAVTSNDARCDSCEAQDEPVEFGDGRHDGYGNELVELHGAELEAARAADPHYVEEDE